MASPRIADVAPGTALRPVGNWTHSVGRPASRGSASARAPSAAPTEPADLPASAARWLELAQAGRSPRLFQRLDTLTIDRPEVAMALLGDTGKGTEPSFRTNRSFVEFAKRHDLRIHTGDIVYETGAKSVDDPQWKEKVEEPLEGSGEIHFVRGNHDDNNAEFSRNPFSDGGSVDVYRQYAETNPDFTFPGPFYARRVEFQGGSVDLFFVDTPLLKKHPELKPFIEAEIAASTADRKIGIGHHALSSHGEHGSDPDLAQTLKPTVKRHMDLYACGHEHDKQLLLEEPVLFLVTGTGAETRPTGAGPNTIYADSQLGFSEVRISRDAITVNQIHADDHRITHTHVHERPEARASRASLRPAARTDRPSRRQRKLI